MHAMHADIQTSMQLKSKTAVVTSTSVFDTLLCCMLPIVKIVHRA